MKPSNRISRRTALKSTTLAAASLAGGRELLKAAELPTTFPPSISSGPFKLPLLGYAYDALEPEFDAATMELHYRKHHAQYVVNLNRTIHPYPELQKLSLEDLLKSLDRVPEPIRESVRNNAGGHFNHGLFWRCLKREGRQSQPEGPLESALGEIFKDDTAGQKAVLDSALTVFGSGWLWITLDDRKQLRVETTSNQDNPVMFGRKPILALDLWEHAYYLKYQNRRADYVKAFFSLIDWESVQKRYVTFIA